MIITDYLNISKVNKENNSLTVKIIHFKCSDISTLGCTRQIIMKDATPVPWETAQNTTYMYCPYHTVFPP